MSISDICPCCGKYMHICKCDVITNDLTEEDLKKRIAKLQKVLLEVEQKKKLTPLNEGK